MKKRILLVHWNAAEAEERAARLAGTGLEVICHSEHGGGGPLRAARNAPPDAVVVDLTRLPSHGRAVGTWLRQQRPTRRVPLLFVGGESEKIARVREVLPDAVFTTWRGIERALARAMKRPPRDPVVPATMSAYRRTPLARKLGIRAGSVVALSGAPEGFEQTLGALPEKVTLRHGARGRNDTVIWFVGSRRELEKGLAAKIRAVAERGGLWIAWPKRASGVETDVTQTLVRRLGLAAGLVDHKICAIDEVWSGLRFVRRRRRAGNLRASAGEA
jgi:hypothetical protein